MNKIVIVGCGNVGMSYAYSIVTGDNAVGELVLIDVKKEKAEGEALDLIHASAYENSNIKIKAGNYSDCNDADIICVCAGSNQNVGETRMDLVDKNIKVFSSIIREINKTKFSGIYLVATNPLDIMTYATYKLSGFAPNRVIGSGTTLDSARLRSILGKKFSVNPKSVHAYVIGEHGDSEMIPWSNATIGLNKIDLTSNEKEEILNEVRNSAYEIINKKGSTSYGIGVCLMKITNAILGDSREVMTVSSYNEDHDCYLGIPSVVGKEGVIKSYYLQLNKDEHQQLSNSVRCLENTLDELRNEGKL